MSTELAPATGTAIFSADPRAVLRESRAIAAELGRVLAERHLVTKISGREYVVIEGWTLLGSMVGVFAEIEWTRQLISLSGEAESIGWEARAVARTIDGRAISAAEASCGRDERTWRHRDDYALRSMAQTRAISKALRLPLGFIVELAGYSATPAEELPPADVATARDPASGGVRELRRRIETEAELRGISPEQLRQIADEAGVTDRASLPQLREILKAVEAIDPDTDLPEMNGEPDAEPEADTGAAT